ncbi:glycoside hydrolase family 43 protein [Deinococcus koreensis]|nr:glycoside hydrolase family 43 protein [Deinococcus koreensis]
MLTGVGALAGGGIPISQSGAATLAPPSAQVRTFSNPVLDANFPDPFILRAGGLYHAYATNGVGGNVPHAVSRDLVTWERSADALPTLAAWAEPGLTWAPEVIGLRGQFVLYYTARDQRSDRQCIGVAVAAQPAGPFQPVGKGPLVCQAELGGSIDASPFLDSDGRAYLLWKNDGNALGLSTQLFIQPLAPDGLSLSGAPTALIQNFQLWEGSVIEAPTLYKQGGVYYLLYSGGPFDSDLYAVGYATASRITGPYRKAAENPVLVSRGEVAGPGHQSVFSDGSGQPWLVYHAWTTGLVGDQVGYRSMRLERVSFGGGRMRVGGPTTSPQPAPRGNP